MQDVAEADRVDRRSGLSWQWSRFGLGVLFALPALAVAPSAPTMGLALAVGVLPAAASGLPPRRRERATVLVIGAVSAAGLLLGSLLALAPVVAVIAVFGLAVLASINATRGHLAQLVLILALPMVGLGLSFSWSTVTVALAGCIVAGSVYAWLVSLLWPQSASPSLAAAPMPRGRAMLVYGILLGAAAASAAAVGFLLGLEHVGWATGAVLLVMRPVRGQLIARSLGRALSVLVGALAAAVLALLSPGPLVLAVTIGLVVGALAATQASRWYVAPAFTTLLVLMLILSTSSASPGERFLERTLETVVGVGLALFFGAVVPAFLAVVTRRRAV